MESCSTPESFSLKTALRLSNPRWVWLAQFCFYVVGLWIGTVIVLLRDNLSLTGVEVPSILETFSAATTILAWPLMTSIVLFIDPPFRLIRIFAELIGAASPLAILDPWLFPRLGAFVAAMISMLVMFRWETASLRCRLLVYVTALTAGILFGFTAVDMGLVS